MMRFRPRYSLLTLLLLTAFVAGGVKLWYGPHHVVEQYEPDWAKEYTYTRDWRGNRIIHGPVVHRRFENQKPPFFFVLYYRRGTSVDWIYQSGESSFLRDVDFSDSKSACPLTAEELLAFHQVRDAELQRLVTKGETSAGTRYEGIRNYVTMGGFHYPSEPNNSPDAIKD